MNHFFKISLNIFNKASRGSVKSSDIYEIIYADIIAILSINHSSLITI